MYYIHIIRKIYNIHIIIYIYILNNIYIYLYFSLSLSTTSSSWINYLDLLKNFQTNLNTYKYLISRIVYVPLGKKNASYSASPDVAVAGAPNSDDRHQACAFVLPPNCQKPMASPYPPVSSNTGELSSKPNVWWHRMVSEENES
jgi:hypothetical protein